MKPISSLLACFFCFVGSVAIHPAMAQDATADPLISLTVKNEPLGDVLETITRDTGYRFNLNGKWKEHPVSATIANLPLEKGPKRLLRSLNHSILVSRLLHKSYQPPSRTSSPLVLSPGYGIIRFQ